MELFVGVVTVALWIFSLVDLIGSDESRIRHLPKLWWLLIVLFFPLAGSIAWLITGRPEADAARGRRFEREAPRSPSTTGPAGRPPWTRRTTRRSCVACASVPRSSAAATERHRRRTLTHRSERSAASP